MVNGDFEPKDSDVKLQALTFVKRIEKSVGVMLKTNEKMKVNRYIIFSNVLRDEFRPQFEENEDITWRDSYMFHESVLNSGAKIRRERLDSALITKNKFLERSTKVPKALTNQRKNNYDCLTPKISVKYTAYGQSLNKNQKRLQLCDDNDSFASGFGGFPGDKVSSAIRLNEIVLRSHQSQNKSVLNFVLNQPELLTGKNCEMEFNDYKSKGTILTMVEKFMNILKLVQENLETLQNGLDKILPDQECPIDGWEEQKADTPTEDRKAPRKNNYVSILKGTDFGAKGSRRSILSGGSSR